jgi:hypothetical protein
MWDYGASMLRPRARVGRARAPGRLHGRLAGALLALLVTLAGCGSGGGNADEPSEDAVACRAKWKDLESKVDGRDSLTNPSALAQRWNTIAVTVEYYARSASGDDCGKTIAGQAKAMDSLASFSKLVAPYDMELTLDEVEADAKAYAAGPRPPAPSVSASPSPSPSQRPSKKDKQQPGKKKKPTPPVNPAPEPAAIAAALKSLTQQAPLATQQQGPGWQQASVAELGDTAAVAKAVRDLAFLSSESPGYRACTLALTQIRAALEAGGN